MKSLVKNSPSKKFFSLICFLPVVAFAQAGIDKEQGKDFNPMVESSKIYKKAYAEGKKMDEKELKRIYLKCGKESSERVFDVDEASFCLGMADALKENVFDGDFNRLITWWQEHRNDDF